MERILNRADVLELLNEILTDSRFINKPYQNSPYGDNYVPNQYSLLLMVDALMKYHIIINDPELVDEYILQLRRIMKKVNAHNDIVYGVNSVLAKIISVKLKIKDADLVENKKKILQYVYNQYIQNGYCFCGIPSLYAEQVSQSGLNPGEYSIHKARYKEIKDIFTKYGLKQIISKDFNLLMDHITLTDSPMMAYFYAFQSPMYFSEFCCKNVYMEDETLYDQGAYYRKDYNACKKNIVTLCKNNSFQEKDMKRVIELFKQEWNMLHSTDQKPTLIYIKRSAVDKNELKDYEQIILNCENTDLVHSIAKITESRFNDYKIYNKIKQADITVQRLPSYNGILKVESPFEELFDFEKAPVVNQENQTTDVPIFSSRFSNAYGNVTVIALIGTLLVTLGATLTILISIYGG